MILWEENILGRTMLSNRAGGSGLIKASIIRVIVSAVLIMSLVVLPSCHLSGNGPEGSLESSDSDLTGRPDEDTLVLGFSQLGSESSWRVGSTVSIQQAAADSGIQLMFENAQQKQENQIKAIRSFIAYQVDVIAFSPIVEDGWDNVLMEAKAAGIPVLLVDRYIDTHDESLFDGFVGSDFEEEGRRAGRFLRDYFDGRYSSVELPEDGKVRIVELMGTEGSSPMRGRYSGFREIIGEDSRFEIIVSESGDFLRSLGKEKMRNIISDLKEQRENDQSDGRIDVLYSHNDGMTLGAIEALREAGFRPGIDVLIISVDGEQAAIDKMKEGEINCVVECTPMMGPLVMELVNKLAAGDTIPRFNYNDEKVFTQFDDLDSLPPRGF